MDEPSPKNVRHPDWGDALWFGLTAPGSAAWSLLAAGDFCPNGAPGRTEACSAELQRLIRSASVSLANLEGPLRGGTFPASRIPLILDPNAVALAKASGFSILGLANNHIADGGSEGISSTIAEIDRANLARCGAGRNAVEALRPAIVHPAAGVELAVFAVCDSFYGEATPDTPGFASMFDPALCGAVAGASRSGKRVVVCAHCGVEDSPLPPPPLRARLHEIAEAGADLVLCSHPHVPQSFESRGRAIIVHSLGNFLFDPPTGRRNPKRDASFVVLAEFSGSGCAGCYLIPIEQHAGQARLMLENPQRDPFALFDYLLRLHRILSDAPRYRACWQEIALQLFRDGFIDPVSALGRVRGELDSDGASRVRQTLELLKHVAYTWLPDSARARARSARRALRTGQAAPPVSHPESGANLDPVRLDVIASESRRVFGQARAGFRIASERFVIDTALGLLSGEEADLRGPGTLDEVTELLRICGSTFEPEHIPFVKR